MCYLYNIKWYLMKCTITDIYTRNNCTIQKINNIKYILKIVNSYPLLDAIIRFSAASGISSPYDFRPLFGDSPAEFSHGLLRFGNLFLSLSLAGISIWYFSLSHTRTSWIVLWLSRFELRTVCIYRLITYGLLYSFIISSISVCITLFYHSICDFVLFLLSYRWFCIRCVV